MYFYIDESGQTGLNLFDADQPFLYYGVLSSKIDLDTAALDEVKALRQRLGVDRLHASELGNQRLVTIVKDINKLNKKYDLTFSFYKVAKADHALISFFDQVFDQGVNPAVPWSSYWTPLKFLHIVNLANLFDESTLKKAWNARITINSARAEAALVEVCQTILERVSGLQDKRSQEILADGLKWAIANPARINYNVNSKDDSLQISPNLVGFQLVMHGIAARLKKSKAQANKIIVDRQTEFNLAQEYIADFYKKYKDVPFLNGPGLPTMDLTHMPTTPITCTPGTESVGLELVDIYIWVFKRHYEEKALAPELRSIINAQLYSGRYDEVSIKALINRWGKWFRELPEPSEEQLAEARIRKAFEEKRRKSNL